MLGIIKIELILCISFFIIPVVLPFMEGTFLPSISDYVTSTQLITYNILLLNASFLMMIDGYIYKTRRYNVVFGILLCGVVAFPVNDHRVIHDIFAVLFFLGNAYITTYHSKLITKLRKNIFLSIISICLTLVFTGQITLYFAEAVGMFILSYFMFIRYSMLKLKDKIVV